MPERKPATSHAPGRVNLIGEHTDYNGGMVLPAALSVGLEITLTPRDDGRVEAMSNQFDTASVRPIDDGANGDWSDPIVGAVQEAARLGLSEAAHSGCTVEVHSDIPVGAGLSSSAALIVAVLKALRSDGGAERSDVDIAKDARRVENDYLDVPCGIMDQMAVALARPGTAMALDTRDLSHRLVQLPRDHAMVVLHSGVTRKLTEGRYAERKEECDAAKAHFGTDDLCLLDPDVVQEAELADAPRKRALHCTTEQRRVLAAIAAMESGNVEALGVAMNESHVSMRDLFEMSLPPIDALVATAVAEGAVGARLTGGGFGGCIVACVAESGREGWLERVLAQHPDAGYIDAAVAT